MTAKLAIATLEHSVKANASCQTPVSHPLASQLNSVFTALAQSGGFFFNLPRITEKNPKFKSQNCRKMSGDGQNRGKKPSVENRFRPAGSPLQQTSKAEATSAAAAVSGSSIESLQSRKVRGRAQAPRSPPLPARRSHQPRRRSVTRHPPEEEEEETPAVFILKSHISL